MPRGSKRRRNEDGWGEFGGYMGAKVQKLKDQFTSESADKTSSDVIFQGIAIHVNGYTNPEWRELKRLMVEHGGTYRHYYSAASVTHVIATNLPDSKLRALTGKKVVHPKWITDSVDGKKLLPYQDYLIGHYKGQSYTAIKKVLPATDSASDRTSHSTVNEDDTVSNSTASHSIDAESETTLSFAEPSTSKLITEHKVETAQADVSTSNTNPLSLGATKKPTTKAASPPKKAGDENFVSEFYSHSRLHHLSTWGAEWKAYVSHLQSVPSTFPARDSLRGGEGWKCEDRARGLSIRVIMHIDMDSFFVSVGLRSRPELRGKPVAVTHSRGGNARPRPGTDLDYELAAWGRGSTTQDSTQYAPSSMSDIASCSYKARKAGVKNGMLYGRAKALCPDLVPIPYDFEGYREVSQVLYDTVASFTHDIEAVSCDELLVDCTDLLSDTGASPLQFASVLRQLVSEKTRCPVSAGLGPSILIARLATRVAKPNGQMYVDPDDVPAFIHDKPVSDLPGVGWSISKKLNAQDIKTCGDLQCQTLSSLQQEHGPKTGQSLYNFSRGIDDRPIRMERERKSVSAEINYGIRFTKDEEMVNFIETLCEEVQSRLTKISKKCKTVTLKLKVRRAGAPMETAKYMGHGICDNLTKSSTLAVCTDRVEVITKECASLLRALNVPPSDLRGVGIQLGRLENAVMKSTRVKSTPSIINFTRSKSELEMKDVTAKLESSVVETSQTENLTDVASTKVTSSDDTTPPLVSIPEDVEDSDFEDTGLDSSLPPLPFLPSFISPSNSQTASERVSPQPSTSVPHRDTYPPDANELDLSCVRALPPELQEELQMMYGTPLRRQLQGETTHDLTSSPPKSPPKNSLMMLLGSPSKNLSPNRRQRSPRKSPKKSPSPKKKSPAFKVPQSRLARGRPRKHNPKKLNFSTKTSSKDVVIPESERVGAASVTVEEVMEQVTEQEVTEISLGGAVTLTDVKQALHEWILSDVFCVTVGSFEDEQLVAEYLQQLAQSRNLERVDLLIRFLTRKVSRLTGEDRVKWTKVQQRIVDQVQPVIKVLYGAHMKLHNT